jgi:MFS family permease
MADPDQVVATGGTLASVLGTDCAPATSLRRAAIAALAGTSIEYYDFFLYGTASALVFPAVFFPKAASIGALLASFSTFAIGFFARPLGAVVFGHFGDRHGRKPALVVALVLMGAATTLIGCLPSYAQVGTVAPLLLITLRLLQGLALGGQWGGAILILTEDAPDSRRGFYGSFAQMGAPIGAILSNVVFLAVSTLAGPDSLISSAWRIPFLLSLALIAVALIMQFKLQDTAAFRAIQEEQMRRIKTRARTDERRSPVIEALRLYPKQILLAAGAFVAMNVSFYVLVTFSLAYGTSASGLHIPSSTMLSGVLLGAIAMVPGTFLSSVISDKHGRRPVLIISAALLACWAFAVFPLINTRSFWGISAALCVGQFLNGMIFGPLAALFSELFPARVRYSGASLGYQIGAILGGALAPLVATALLVRFGTPLAVSIYMAVMCVLTIYSVWLIIERRSTSPSSLEL